MTVMLVILWVFALLRCALGWWWWHDVHKLIFLRQATVVVWCMGVLLGMGRVGSWVHKFTWQRVIGLGQLFGGLGRVDENRPTDNSGRIYCSLCKARIFDIKVQSTMRASQCIVTLLTDWLYDWYSPYGEILKRYRIVWRWLCCTQTDSWGQRGMETQRKDVKTCCTAEDYWWYSLWLHLSWQ